MGKDKVIFNLDRCEYVRGHGYGYRELALIGQGVSDPTRWWYLGPLHFAILLGATPKAPSPLGFYERYWGRWRNNRITAAGDFTGEYRRVYNTCPAWIDITHHVDVAIAELFMHMAQADSASKNRYLAYALMVLKESLPRIVREFHPYLCASRLLNDLMELGEYDIRDPRDIDDCCTYTEELDGGIYIGYNCAEHVIEYDVDERVASALEVLFREDEHVAVPHRVALALQAFIMFAERGK